MVTVGQRFECDSTGFSAVVTRVTEVTGVTLLTYQLQHNGTECHSTIGEFLRVYRKVAA